MIINLPSNEDFEKLGKNCLIQAFDIVYETDNVLKEYGEKALLDDVWKYSQGKLNTAVVLIHQAIESFMKASVCRTSPYLLLESRRKDWPVLPGQGDKDFNDFYTTPAESLLRTYAATAEATLNSNIIAHIEEVRTLRNQIVHGISKTELTPTRLVAGVLDTFLYFLGKDSWWRVTFDEHLEHPLVKFHGFGISLAKLPDRLDYAEALLGKTSLARHFAQNIKARRYLCPFCKIQWESEMQDEPYPYRWAFLSELKKVEEWVVTCVNCTIESVVYRADCYYTACKGSVIHYWEDNEKEHMCLTCGRTQYAGTQAEDDAKFAIEEEQRAEEFRLRMDSLYGIVQPTPKKKRVSKNTTKPTPDA